MRLRVRVITTVSEGDGPGEGRAGPADPGLLPIAASRMIP